MPHHSRNSIVDDWRADGIIYNHMDSNTSLQPLVDNHSQMELRSTDLVEINYVGGKLHYALNALHRARGSRS